MSADALAFWLAGALGARALRVARLERLADRPSHARIRSWRGTLDRDVVFG